MFSTKLMKGVAAVCIAASLLTIPASAATIGTGTVKADYLNLRASASTTSASQGLISNGETVVVEEASGDWYKVCYNGTEGYVKGEYIELSTSSDYSGTAHVNTTDVRFRAEPNTSCSVLGTYGTGTELTVLGIEGDWVKAQINGVTGYMKSDYVSFTTAVTTTTAQTAATTTTASASTTTTTTTAASGTQAWISSSSVRFRSGPGTDYKILGTYGTGTAMTVLGTEGNWVKATINGTTGYVCADYVSYTQVASTASSLGQQIAAYAQKYVGCTYAWGATGPSSFDCSGLCYYVYGQFGYKLSRTAQQQYNNNGTWVDKANLQPGDLVFFGSSSYIGHVGIYIGDGKFVHASTYGVGVIISELSSSYYTSRYQGAKRIVS